MVDFPLATSVKLVSGHPDDQNPEEAALTALRAASPMYSGAWPRETAYRYLHAISADAEADTRAVSGPPSEKDLAAFVRTFAPSREREAFKVHEAVLLYEVVHGSERVASEIVAHLERRADALFAVTDESDHLFTMLRGLALVRDRMTHSDRSRLDARIRVLLAFHAKGTPLAAELERILRRPESIAPPPAIEEIAPPTAPVVSLEEPPTAREKKSAKAKKPSKKKAK
jgi:hypothetical protein